METFRLFDVKQPTCHIVRITVVQARNIGKKSLRRESITEKASNLISEGAPDPYIVLEISDIVDGKRMTRTINNQPNPFWNETFEFYVDANKTNILEISLMDADYIADDELSCQKYDLSLIPLNQEIVTTLLFDEVTEVIFKFYRSVDDTSPSLRFSTDLCNEEKAFLMKRQKHIFEALKSLLGDEGPKEINEVPCIAVLGSGGGFRAMVGLSGVIKALHNSGILDCVNYISGISGSTWCIASLYSHPDFPTNITANEFNDELKSTIDQSPFGLLWPQQIYNYLEEILQKQNNGQPISFTDLFGILLRNTLLKRRPETKLSHQRKSLEDGAVPLPLYACLHVKKNVQARVYHEWVEFSPYEIGIAKYGVFMKSEYYGSKFFLGRLRHQFSEYPLHYLLGIWGSAFCILFRQLLWMNEMDKMLALTLDSNSAKKEEALQKQVDEFTINDIEDDEDKPTRYISYKRNLPKTCIRATAKVLQELSGSRTLPYSKLVCNAIQMKTKTPQCYFNDLKTNFNLSTFQRLPLNIIHEFGSTSSFDGEELVEASSKVYQMLHSAVKTLHSTEALNSISGRAALIYNPLRGLQLEPRFNEENIASTSRADEENFKGLHEPLSTNEQSLYMVDGGLAFNSPYPLLLRPERKVQLILSFDFSSRLKDQVPPFKDLLLAEEWACKARLPFPPIQEIIREKYSSDPVQEFYVFQHPEDRNCPIIVHFVLINGKFKEFKAPGVIRQTPEDKKMANFTIFEDFGNPFSIFNFKYSNEKFDQLSQLMEFNTLLGVDAIKTLISLLINPKQPAPRVNAKNSPRQSFPTGLISSLFNFLRNPVCKVVPNNKVGIVKKR